MRTSRPLPSHLRSRRVRVTDADAIA